MSNIIHLNRGNNDKGNKKKKDDKVGYKPVIKALIIALLLIALIIASSYIFRVQEFEISGNRLYSDEEVMKILDLEAGDNIFQVYMNSNKSIKNYSYIEKVSVEYINYNKVKIMVAEKQIIGYIPYMSDLLCIDKKGYILDYVKPENRNKDIPLIEGISSEVMVVGEKIQIPEEIIQACYLFYKSSTENNIFIEKIRFNNNRTDKISLKIENKTIEFGNIEYFSEKFKAMMGMMSQIPKEESGTLFLGDDGKKNYYKKNLKEK